MKQLWKRWAPPVVVLAVAVALVVRLNQMDKVPLVSRAGQTFEKGVVTEILQDNLQPNGTRVGEQRLLVRMTTGVRAGEELETTSFISQITEINVEKTYDIVIWYGTQFEVKLGGTDEMAYKIQFLASILDQLEGEQGGTVDLTLEEKNSAIFTPWQNSQELNADSEEKTAENS